MRLNQLKSIHSWVRTTDTSEIVFVSALLLPLYLLLYNSMINQVEPSWKVEGLISAVVLYAVGIIWMKSSQSAEEKNQRDLLVIKNYILDKNHRYYSFERLHQMDKRFTEKRIRELIFIFPEDLRLARLGGSRPGIKVLGVEEEEPESEKQE